MDRNLGRWEKKFECKFASDAIFNENWAALFGLIENFGISADCPYPGFRPLELVVAPTDSYLNAMTDVNKREKLKKEIPNTMKVTIHRGTPLLHQLIIQNSAKKERSLIPFLERLLKNRADIDFKEVYHGYTPLHIAASLCQNEVVSLLLEKNADYKITDNNGLYFTQVYPDWCSSPFKLNVRTPLR